MVNKELSYSKQIIQPT